MQENDTFRIQLKIAGKSYPIFCKRSEELFYRKAANLINDKLLQYGRKYQGPEIAKQDLLVMTTCDITLSKLKLMERQDDSELYKKLEDLNKELEDFFKSI